VHLFVCVTLTICVYVCLIICCELVCVCVFVCGQQGLVVRLWLSWLYQIGCCSPAS